MAPEASADDFDEVFGQVGDVAESLVLNLAVFAESAPQKVGAIGFALIGTSSSGYVNGTVSAWHALNKIQISKTAR